MSSTHRVAVILDIAADAHDQGNLLLPDEIAEMLAEAFAARDVLAAIVNVVVDTRKDERFRVIDANTRTDPRLEVNDPNILR